MNRLYVVSGDDAQRLTTRLLEAIRPESGLRPGATIVLKPNLVVPKDWRSGATTNPVICEAVITYFKARGFSDITILESAWIGADTRSAFRVCGYEALSRRTGVPLVDVKKDGCETREYGGMKIDISRRALAADYIVNLPLIKGHCQTALTCALKNLKGLLPDREKRRFHTLGLHKPIAYLNRMIRPGLTIADGIYTDPGFEEGGNPVRMNVMAAGDDSVLLDAYAAGLLGLRVSDVAYIRMAEQIGVGSADVAGADIVYIGDAPDTAAHTRARELDRAKAQIDARDACSACYANLLGAMLRTGSNASVCVGQGFKGQTGVLGCGNCTRGFTNYVEGCPPRAEDIESFLQARRDI